MALRGESNPQLLHRASRAVIFALPPHDLTGLRQRRQRIRYRHLARLVAFEAERRQQLTAGETTGGILNRLQDALSLAAAPFAYAAPWVACPSNGFPTLGCLIGVDRARLVVDGCEFLFEFVLLVEDRLTLGLKPRAVFGDEVSEVAVRHVVSPWLIGELVTVGPTKAMLLAFQLRSHGDYRWPR